jgi:hypothetical protein
LVFPCKDGEGRKKIKYVSGANPKTPITFGEHAKDMPDHVTYISIGSNFIGMGIHHCYNKLGKHNRIIQRHKLTRNVFEESVQQTIKKHIK